MSLLISYSKIGKCQLINNVIFTFFYCEIKTELQEMIAKCMNIIIANISFKIVTDNNFFRFC